MAKLRYIGALAGALLLASTAAHALTFNFSFTNTAGDGTAGTVTGQVVLSTDNAIEAATSVTIDSYPAAVGSLGTVPITVSLAGVVSNSFDVSSGQIIASDFVDEFALNDFLILNTVHGVACLEVNVGSPAAGSCNQFSANPSGGAAVDDLSFTSANFTATPLPSALPLFATALGALGLLGWRRKRKAQAVA